MTRLPFALAFALAFLTAGCASLGIGTGTGAGPPASLTLSESCSSYARNLKTLSEARAAGKLDAATVQRISAAREIADPLCLDQAATGLDSATLDKLRAPLATIVNIAAGV